MHRILVGQPRTTLGLTLHPLYLAGTPAVPLEFTMDRSCLTITSYRPGVDSCVVVNTGKVAVLLTNLIPVDLPNHKVRHRHHRMVVLAPSESTTLHTLNFLFWGSSSTGVTAPTDERWLDDVSQQAFPHLTDDGLRKARRLLHGGPLEGQHGVAISRGSTLVAVKLFGKSELLEQQWETLLIPELKKVDPSLPMDARVDPILPLLRAIERIAKSTVNTGPGFRSHQLTFGTFNGTVATRGGDLVAADITSHPLGPLDRRTANRLLQTGR